MITETNALFYKYSIEFKKFHSLLNKPDCYKLYRYDILLTRGYAGQVSLAISNVCNGDI
jgi:hypothetical protein